MEDTQDTNLFPGNVVDQDIITMDNQFPCVRDAAWTAKGGMIGQIAYSVREYFVERKRRTRIVRFDDVIDRLAVLNGVRRSVNLH